MGRELDLSRTIEAPVARVWELLERPVLWKTWWTECQAALPRDNKALREGSQIELVLKPDYKSYTFFPVIDLFTEGKALSLTHRSVLIAATAVFYLSESKHGSHVRLQAVIEGLGMTWLGLSGRGELPQQVLDSGLRGLKRVAERMG